jgi:YidC/Oxa1 family membrane protein insertase|tara:strand:- start:1090 stop:1833 length:744 start_codon:yes stop_codon:yes gene_type:complete
MIELFNTLIFDPLYNGLIFLVSVVPFADVGIAVILLTILVRIILFPLSLKATRTQMLVRGLEPELTKIKEKYKKDKQEQAKQTMALYKEKKINPFSSFLFIFIQIPIILGLYWVFFRGGLPEVNVDILYSFISTPELINMEFLGLVDVSERNIILALLAGITQFFQAKLSLPPLKKRSQNPSLKDDLARSFHMQMRYILPIIVVVIAYTISAAIAIYWTTSNLFSIGQEIFVRHQMKKEKEKQSPIS